MFSDLAKWCTFLIVAAFSGTGAVFILEEPWRLPEPREVVPRGDLAPDAPAGG